MRYAQAVWRPGAAGKVYPDQNRVEGIVCHSAEGSIDGLLRRVADPAAQVSWHFSVAKDGTVYQHYETEASCWHGGNKRANTTLIGIEHEGVAGEPLTEAQTAASVALCRWIAAIPVAWSMERRKTLWEHNEVVLWEQPNAGPTQCPSGRIPWERYTDAAAAPNTAGEPERVAVSSGVSAAMDSIHEAQRALDTAVAALQGGQP